MSFDDGFNCPNCGAELSCKLRHSKMVACEYCESTVLLEDETVRKVGKSGVMAEEPSLFVLGREIIHKDESFLPVGQARFGYANGWWDEFWAIGGDGQGVWVSVDEGEIAIERPYPITVTFNPDALTVGSSVILKDERFRITEADTATCKALRGEFPEPIRIGQTYRYWHLSGERARIVTLEYSDGEFQASEGVWVDPYLIRSSNVAA